MKTKTQKLSIASIGLKTKLLLLLAISTLLLALSLLPRQPAGAAAGINPQLNFQGRLLNADGSVVADGNYNMQFKVYQDGDGVLGGGDETLKWTETRLNNNSQGVVVKNGYFSVNLGSVTAFGSSVDWNQDTLWLSIHIGGTNGTCTPFSTCAGSETEMSPFKRLTSTPYALNSDRLGGLQAASFVQLAQGLQTDASTANASIAINKTGGTANVLTLQRAGADVLTIDTNGLSIFSDDVTLSLAGAENLELTHDLAGTVNLLSITGTPNGSANTAYGLYIDQADSANGNGFDASLVIDNSDAGLAIADGLLFVNSGGGFTRGITIAGATTDITTGTDENLTLDANGTGGLVFTGYDCTGQTNGGALTADASGNISCSADDGGAGGGYATIQNEGTGLTQRTTLNFIGGGVNCVDNAGATKTDCTVGFISGDGAGASSSASGLEEGTGGFGLLQGCADDEVLKWNDGSSVWECGSDRATVQIVKASDETINNSSTVQDDDELLFAGGTNNTWIVQFNVNRTGSSTADFRVAVNAATGSTCVYGDATSDSGQANNSVNGTCGTVIDLATNAQGGFHVVAGTVTTASTSGNIVLQWAQRAAVAENLTVEAGSSLLAYKVNGADLAEMYYSANGVIEPGTVVTADTSIAAGVKPTSKPYDNSIMGVISTQPGLVIGDNSASGYPVPLALSGRIPVKVSSQNGPIQPGDLLTSSSTPGVAMKATKSGGILGQALEAFSGDGVGLVMTFVKTSYGTGSWDELTDSATAAGGDFSKAVLSQLMTNSAELIAESDLSEIYTDRLAAGLEVVTPKVTTNELAANSLKAATEGNLTIGLAEQSRLVLANPNDHEVVGFDSAGNATFAGTITANKVKANQIEGFEIYADAIRSLTGQATAGWNSLLSTNSSGDGIMISSPANSTAAFQLQNASGTSLVTLDTVNSALTLSGTTLAYLTINLADAHFKSSQTNPPTIETPTNCGSGELSAEIGEGSTDSAGSFRITAGTNPAACDTVITFDKPYGAAPKSILVVAQAKNGGSGTAAARQIFVSDSDAYSFTVKMYLPPATNEVNWFYYWVIE